MSEPVPHEVQHLCRRYVRAANSLEKLFLRHDFQGVPETGTYQFAGVTESRMFRIIQRACVYTESLAAAAFQWNIPHQALTDVLHKLSGDQPFIFDAVPAVLPNDLFESPHLVLQENSAQETIRKIIAEAKIRAKCNSEHKPHRSHKPSEQKTYSPSDIEGMMGINSDTRAKYMAKAKVHRAARGQRNKRYSIDEFKRILQSGAEMTTTTSKRVLFKSILQSLSNSDSYPI